MCTDDFFSDSIYSECKNCVIFSFCFLPVEGFSRPIKNYRPIDHFTVKVAQYPKGQVFKF